MTNYPLGLITNYRAGNITRQQFCHEWAKLQGFDDTVKGYGNKHGIFMQYRGRTARITNGLLCWENKTANSVFELRRKIDFYLNAINDGGAKWT